MTKYHVVRDRLLDQLDGMAAGEPLPPERTLAQTLGVSRATLRRAVDDLVATGQVRRRVGAGVFALGPKLTPGLTASSFTQDMLSRRLTPRSTVLSIHTRAAGTRIGRRLGIDETEHVVLVERLRLADEEPMAIEMLHVPERIVPELTQDDLTDGSFYEVLRLRYGVELAGATQTVSATVTDEEESANLQVPLHSPALLLERSSRDTRGRQVEYVRSLYRADRYQLSIDLAAPAAVGGDR